MHERVRAFRGVGVPLCIDRNALARGSLFHTIVALERRNEPGQTIFVDRPMRTPSRQFGWLYEPDSESIT